VYRAQWGAVSQIRMEPPGGNVVTKACVTREVLPAGKVLLVTGPPWSRRQSTAKRYENKLQRLIQMVKWSRMTEIY
jgi:hypothetical protein